MESSVRNVVRLVFPEGINFERLREAWGSDLLIHKAEESSVRLFDTFEWQLWFGGCVLYSNQGAYHLAARESGWIGRQIGFEKKGQAPVRFASDFENMQIRERLRPMLDLRGLAEVGEAVFKKYLSELRDDVGKIVCRFEWLEVFGKARERSRLACYVRVLPLLGYVREADVAVNILRAHGGEEAHEGPLDVVLRHSGKTPRVKTLRPVFGLESLMAARPAVGLMVRAILKLARENEENIPGDIDTEFLHDYRICIRKLRSLLGLVKGVYPEEGIREVRLLLGKLARETNRLRDLDVYLLAKDQTVQTLPPRLRSGLDTMYSEFKSQRAIELRKVSARLCSAAHQKLFRKIEDFFAEDRIHFETLNSGEPIGRLVFGRIYKRYQKIRMIAETLSEDSPDEAVHELRIEGKKLRYLMEFFAEFIPSNGIEKKEKQLRRLQGQLGEFNDCSVQQKALFDYWLGKTKASQRTEVAMALGGLVAVLNYRQKEQRSKIYAALGEFCSDDTADLFKQTFKIPKDGDSKNEGSAR